MNYIYNKYDVVVIGAGHAGCEAFAIRYHMGFSGNEDKNSVGRALEMFPLALAVSVADMEASYYLEGSN